MPVNRWLLDQVRAGIGQVFGSTRELFIPQMINLQALGGVSFKKGCYTGQEIVARMQYLGKLKRRLQHLAVEGDPGELPAPGVELFSPVHNSSVGEVVLAATSADGIELLAVVQEDAAADGRLYLGSPDGLPLSLLELPYSLNPDQGNPALVRTGARKHSPKRRTIAACQPTDRSAQATLTDT